MYAVVVTLLLALLSAFVVVVLLPTRDFQAKKSNQTSNSDGGNAPLSCLGGSRTALEIIKSKKMLGMVHSIEVVNKTMELINIHESGSQGPNRNCSATVKYAAPYGSGYMYYRMQFDVLYLEDKKDYSINVHPIALDRGPSLEPI